MRLIDADALIREAKRRNETYNLRGLSKAISDIVQDMTTYAPHPYEMRWIPCSECLPEMHEFTYCTDDEVVKSSSVVLFCDRNSVHTGYCESTAVRDRWYTEDGESCDGVTAWMPLPEVYKED